MKKFLYMLLIALPFLMCNACSNFENLPDSTIHESDSRKMLACKSMEQSLCKVGESLSEDSTLLNTLYSLYDKNATRSENVHSADSCIEAQKIVDALDKSSEDVFTAFQVEDTDSLTANEKRIVALALYAEYMDQHEFTTRGGTISGNHYVDCLTSALGIKELTKISKSGIEKYIKKYGAKKALKLMGKCAGKTLSYVGWGLAIYDFITCL